MHHLKASRAASNLSSTTQYSGHANLATNFFPNPTERKPHLKFSKNQPFTTLADQKERHMSNNVSNPRSLFQAVLIGRFHAQLNQVSNNEAIDFPTIEEAHITQHVLSYLAQRITVANMRGLTCQQLWDELVEEIKAQGGFPCAL